MRISVQEADAVVQVHDGVECDHGYMVRVVCTNPTL
jgi:hypothetical protein